MNEDLKFPVKYAILELRSPGGFYHNYEDIVEGFIVSKCFVVGSEIKYFFDGKIKDTFKVFFPFDDISYFKDYREDKKKTIGVDASNNYYLIRIVNRLFDTYEEAKCFAEQENRYLIAKAGVYASINNPNYMEESKKIKAEIKERLNVCQKYEDYITENTKNINVTEDERIEALQRLRKK